MILLITPSAKVQECAKALEEATAESLQIAPSLRQAAAHLRSDEYSVVVLDQFLVEAEPEESDLILQHVGSAVPMYANFAISGIDRVARELRAAVNRHKREVGMARQSAEHMLRSELKGTLTALMLSCELALQAPDQATSEGKIRQAYELAVEMSNKLGIARDDQVLKAAN